MKKKSLLLFAVMAISINAYSTVFTTVANGNWGVPATWGGVYVSSFFPTPVASSNYFTAGVGDTIIVNHAVTMDYNIFVRSADVLVIGPSGSITHGGTAANNSMYNLSPGTGAMLSGITAGIYVQGTLSLEYFRNSAAISVESTGSIVTSSGVGTGMFDNYGDIFHQGTITLAGPAGDVNHNAGDLWMYAGSLIDVQVGSFYNRAVIRDFPVTACIMSNGDFQNLLGAAVVANGGGVSSNANVDNSSNPIANWDGANWCAGSSGINVPAGMESCPACSTPLAIEDLTLSAQWLEQAVHISWTNASEHNWSHYVLERRTEQDDFTDVYSTHVDQSPAYTYTDREADPAQTNYYRLLVYDMDGALVSERLISVAPKDVETFELSCFPNPVTNELNLDLQSSIKANCELSICDMPGNVIYAETCSVVNGTTSIRITQVDWKPGVYFVRVVGSSMHAVKKIVVQ